MAFETTGMLRALRTQRTRTKRKLRKLDKAIAILRDLSSNSVPARRGKSRRMSAAARRKIAAAQRKRWAKFHQQRA